MPKKFWQFRNMAGGSAELLLYGDIADSSWWGDEVTPKQFADDLNALGAVSRITVRINSGGGDVFAAQAIGNLLEQHAAEVVAHIDGLCASAATIVASHCAKVVAANDSTYMVHPVKMGAYGYYNAEELQKYIEALAAIKESVVNLYVKKTGRTKDEVTAWMDATSWWTSEEAKANGFVDELVDEEAPTVENRGGVLFVNSVSMNLPFDKAPNFVQDSQAAAPAAGCVENNNCHEEVKEVANEIRNAEELRNAYPDLVGEIVNAAVAAERQRIMDIENMALPGHEEMTTEAKFTKPISASDYAQEAMKLVKTQGNAYLSGAQADAANSGMGNIANEATGGQKPDAFMDALKTVGGKK